MTVRLACAVALLLCVRGAVAADSPAVQVDVSPEAVTVGEPVMLRVTVYAPTWFPQPPKFPSFELPNTITLLPPNSTGPVTRQVGRSTWSGIQRRYRVYPLIAGQFLISGRAMEVTYADPDSRQPITVTVPIPDVVITSRVPAGAEVLEPYIAGEEFELDQQIDGDTHALEAGDALVVRYQATLKGLPSMFLPPLFQAPELAGVSIYVEEPQLSEADGVARREEKVILVFEAGGDYQLPALEFGWWNLRTNSLETATLPALTLSVIGPELAPPVPAESRGSQSGWGTVFLSALAILLGVVVLQHPLRRLVAGRRTVATRHPESEAEAFQRLRRALADGNPKSSYHALLAWLPRLSRQLELDDLMEGYGNAPLAAELEHLRRQLFADGQTEPDYAALRQALVHARQNWLTDQARTPPPLPTLNPEDN